MTATLAKGAAPSPPQGHSEPGRRSRLWFERLYARLGLPLWAGAILIGYLPFIIGLAIGHWAAGLWDVFLRDVPAVHLPISVGILASQMGASYACDRMHRLQDYARGMVEGSVRVDLGGLYRLGPIVVLWLLLNLFGNGAYVVSLSPGLTLTQVLLTQISTWPIQILFLTTFLWVWGYSMLVIYRIGKLPLRLGSFTEDRMLGLAPFARESLRLTAVYLALLAVMAFPQIIAGGFGPLVALMLLSFFPLGLGFFLLPLIPLRRKLQRAKGEKMRWIGAEYTKVMASVDTIGGMDDATSGRLTAIDKIQRDIRQIRTWPFETGILARLVGIVVSVTAILLATIVRLALRI